uniref:Hexose transporter 1 n=1 Tax=Corethron hystrix TaxID=216773 RepID=A0A7S1BWB8_9STRA
MLTPMQMGRKELYDSLPFTATFGLQKQERKLSQAFASYAADLDMLANSANEDGFIQMEDVAPQPKPGSEEEARWKKTQHKVMDELEIEAGVLTPSLMMAVLIAVLVMFLSGYNTGVMNAPAAVVFPGHSIGIWSLAVSAFAVGGPIGSGVAGSLADSSGRRNALLLNMWTFFFGGMILSLAPDMYTIIVARFFIGVASGSATVLVPIYLGELAPPTLRGTLGTMTQFATVIGILASALLAFPFGTPDPGWRYLFAVTPVVSLMQIACGSFLLESPRWILSRDPQSLKARSIIKKLRGLRFDYEVETEVELFLSAAAVQDNEAENNGSAVVQMFQDLRVRHLAVAAVLLQMAQQLCGINAVFYYSTAFFEGIIDNPLVGTTTICAVNVVATYVALLLMDSCGRRVLILWSSGGMLISVIVIVLALLGYMPNVVALIAVNVYVSFFEIGLGPIPWLIVAEMFDAKYVATAMSLSSQVNWTCNFIVGLVFPYLDEYLHAYSFAPFGIVLLMTFLFAAFKLPETQGTTPQELQKQITRRNSSAQFHNFNIDESYVNPVDMEWRIAMEQIRQEEEKAMQDGSYSKCY